jgi:hypothetical protein
MKRRDFIKRSGLSALTAWAGSSLLLNAWHAEEDMIGEPDWIVEGSFDRALPLPTAFNSYYACFRLRQSPFISLGENTFLHCQTFRATTERPRGFYLLIGFMVVHLLFVILPILEGGSDIFLSTA